MLKLLILIIFIYVLHIINLRCEKYLEYPLYTKMHEYLKEGQKYSSFNIMNNLKKNCFYIVKIFN